MKFYSKNIINKLISRNRTLEVARQKLDDIIITSSINSTKNKKSLVHFQLSYSQ